MTQPNDIVIGGTIEYMLDLQCDGDLRAKAVSIGIHNPSTIEGVIETFQRHRMNKFATAIRSLMDESDYHLYRVVVELAPAEAEAIRLIEAGRKVVTP